jgi:hypothetical protein
VILINAESWNELSTTHSNQLESVDQFLSRKFFKNVRQDLPDLKIPEDISTIKSKSKNVLKNLFRTKAYDF